MLDLEPAEVLGALDEVAEGLGSSSAGRTRRSKNPADMDLAEVYLATCIYVVYDAVTRRCTIANAGHLPPVLVEPGEDPLLLEVPRGVPLGVGSEPFEEVEVELPEGALLALYTDGLVESTRSTRAWTPSAPHWPARSGRWRTSATTSWPPSTPPTARTTSRC
jgi:hypothetical protein